MFNVLGPPATWSAAYDLDNPPGPELGDRIRDLWQLAHHWGASLGTTASLKQIADGLRAVGAASDADTMMKLRHVVAAVHDRSCRDGRPPWVVWWPMETQVHDLLHDLTAG